MSIMTGLSGNEIYCVALKGLSPGELVIGNSVYSLGFVGGIGAGLQSAFGGEVTQITSIIHEGRAQSYARMVHEAQQRGAAGITGVTSDLRQFRGNVEFLSIEFMAIGTAVKRMPGIATATPTLPPQAIIQDKDTWVSTDNNLFASLQPAKQDE